MCLRRQRASTTQADFCRNSMPRRQPGIGRQSKPGRRPRHSAAQQTKEAPGHLTTEHTGKAGELRYGVSGPGHWAAEQARKAAGLRLWSVRAGYLAEEQAKGGLPCSLCFCLGALPSPPWEKRASRIPILPGSHGVAEGGGRRTPVRSPGSGRRRQGNRRHRVPSDSPPF